MRRQCVSSRFVSSASSSSSSSLLLRVVFWLCTPPHSPSPFLFLSLTLHAVFISFHFVRGLELNLLENASNSKFYEFTTFRFLPQQPPFPLPPTPSPLLLLDIFFYTPSWGHCGATIVWLCACVSCVSVIESQLDDVGAQRKLPLPKPQG